MRDCFEKLPPSKRELLTRYYSGQQTIRELAAELGQNYDAVQKALLRARMTLSDCAGRYLATKGTAMSESQHSPSDPKRREVYELADALLRDAITADEVRRLKELLSNDAEARRWYMRFMHQTILLRTWSLVSSARQVEQPQDGAGYVSDLALSIQLPIVDQPPVAFPSPLSALQCLLNNALLCYTMATVILGIGVLGACAWLVRSEHKVQLTAGLPTLAVRDGRLGGESVARIIGAKDCRWAEPRTAATVGETVAVGRKFAVASGKLDIAYNIGDRVTLEGPATYEVDSNHSGRLSAGKLTFRSVAIDFIGGALGDVSAKGHRTVPAFVKPQFYVRGPGVTVVDRIAEFTLSIEQSGTSNTLLVQGSIELRYPHGVKPGDSISGRCWWTAEGDKTHFWRAVCHAGEIPAALKAEADKYRRGNGRTFVQAGGSAPLDRPPSKNDVSGENVKPEVGLP